MSTSFHCHLVSFSMILSNTTHSIKFCCIANFSPIKFETLLKLHKTNSQKCYTSSITSSVAMLSRTILKIKAMLIKPLVGYFIREKLKTVIFDTETTND